MKQSYGQKIKKIFLFLTAATVFTVSLTAQLGIIAIGAYFLSSNTQERTQAIQNFGQTIVRQRTATTNAPVNTDQIDYTFRVVIDPGHGGKDGGVQGLGGTRESDLTLTISHLLREQLEQRGVHVTMTRKDEERLADENARHQQRSDILNRHEIIEEANPDLLVSIHLNSFPGNRKVNGLQIFYQKGGKTGQNFANAMQAHLNKTGLFKPREPMPGDYLILETMYPSVLIECGFLSNPEEEKKLNTPEYQNQLATHIADAIVVALITGENYLFN